MANAPTPPGLLRTLAIAPGTREMGYAILEGTELLHFGVHTFPHGLPRQRLVTEDERFVVALIETFAPHLFVIEQTRYARSRRSDRLHGFVDAMQRLAERRKLMAMAYLLGIVTHAMAGEEAASRRQMAETLARQGYPYLAKYLATDLRTKERYWEKMFDALALGPTGYEEVSRQKALKSFRMTLPP